MTPKKQSQDLDSLPQWAKELILQLIARNQELEAQVQKLETRVQELEAQLAKNSSNSGKPPSSDGFKKQPKTKSQRGKSGRKPGGQNGHQGRTLEQVDKADHIVVHNPMACEKCKGSLIEVDGASIEKRQVFDLPEPKVEVTEHRIQAKVCPCCGVITKGKFPEMISAPVQYGERVQALAAYFSHQHFLPFDRLSQMFKDVFGIGVSPATCINIDRKLFSRLEPFERNLKLHLVASKVLHFDETGMRCKKKLHWIHVASSEFATFYGIHAKRGKKAIDEFNILPQFQGTAIHDHWVPYLSYTHVKHGLCNSHHVRELTFIHEHEKEEWAKEMKEFLHKAKKLVEDNREQGFLSDSQLSKLEKEYGKIIIKGLHYHLSLPPLGSKKRGKKKQRVGKNLLDRLADHSKSVLRFMYDFCVPFTNNQGEQDIRMVKLKQKISGCFRTFEGGQVFCRIRSYISTARKQGWHIWNALADAIKGQPRLLSIRSSPS